MSSVSAHPPLLLSSFLNMNVVTLRVAGLFVALCIYAAFGSPTPDGFGWVEVLVAAGLVFAVGGEGIRNVLRFRTDVPLWFFAGQILLFYGLVFGCLGALLQGQDMRLAVRDVIPFLFMALPLFLFHLRDIRLYRAMMGGVLVIGVLFALRAGQSVLPFDFNLDGNALYYLGNSPCVLFAALLCIGLAFERLGHGLGLSNVVWAMVLFSIAAVAILPLVLSYQRASLGAVAVYSFIALGLVFLRAPRRAIVIMAILGPVFILMFGGFVEGVWSDLWLKTRFVGLNARAYEWQAVWSEIRGSGLSVFFGNGWGARFSSPAVADIRVNFTHSLLSSMVLKLGVFGFLLTCFYLVTLGREMMLHIKGQALFVMALAAPIAIDVFLYAAYKSLDFGLILVLIPLLVVRGSLLGRD